MHWYQCVDHACGMVAGRPGADMGGRALLDEDGKGVLVGEHEALPRLQRQQRRALQGGRKGLHLRTGPRRAVPLQRHAPSA